MSKNKSIYNMGDALLINQKLTTNNFGRLFALFTNLTLNRFEWLNLPPTICDRHIEKALYENGQCFVFEHKDYGIIALPCHNSDQLNIYGEPTGVTVTGVGESFGNIPVDEGVRILNNDLAYPGIINVLYYVNLMSKVDETMAINLDKLKIPYIISTTKENEKTMRIIMDKIKSGEDEIVVDSMLTNGGKLGIEILNTNVPYLIKDLQDHKNNLLCEFLTITGLNNTNANNDKRERLLVDEVNVNNGEILMYLDLEFKSRLRACKEINAKFGTNISVRKRIDDIAQDKLGGNKDETENDVD